MITAIIVDDEKTASDHLESLLSVHFPEIGVIKVCHHIPDAVAQVKTLRPQIVFLDVDVKPHSGFDLLEHTKDIPYEVIFTTGYDTHAVKAFQFSAVDYILKPFGKEALGKAIDLFKSIAPGTARRKIDALLHNLKNPTPGLQKISIPVMGGYEYIDVSNILFCEAQNTSADLSLLNNKKTLCTKTLKWVEERLTDHLFFRVHASYLINLQHVVSFKHTGETGEVTLSNGRIIPVSKRKKDDFLKNWGG